MNDSDRIKALQSENSYLRHSIALDSWRRFAEAMAVRMGRIVQKDASDEQLRVELKVALSTYGYHFEWTEPTA